ncbi:hypothetical protein LDENG_00242320 [Lucifuga dentata]|nr:hypothetical protein LDENG_00242320 [Lucifuga dentata]
MALPYLSDLLQHHTTTRSLRSADANLLKTIRTRSRAWGDLRCCCSLPLNNFPMHICPVHLQKGSQNPPAFPPLIPSLSICLSIYPSIHRFFSA